MAPARPRSRLAWALGTAVAACAAGADLRAQLLEAGADLRAQPLEAGAAAVPIAVPQAAPLAGYGDRGPGNVHAGTLAPVESRALVIAGAGGRPRVGIVALDVLISTPPLVARVAAGAASLRLDALVVAATHTHAGPGGYVDAFVPEAAIMGWYRAEVEDALVAAAVSALERAAERLIPARIGTATAVAPGLGANRRREGGPSDPGVPVVRVDALSGDPIATLFALAAHPTVLSPANALLSPDYPGAARAAVERALGGFAVFLAGPLGDQKPVPPSGLEWPEDLGLQRRDARELGDRLGTVVAEAAALTRTDAAAAVAFAEAPWRLPPVDVRGACAGYVFAPLLHVLARRTFPEQTQLVAVRLAELRLLASPMELGVEVAAELQARSPGPLLVAAHANGWLGYLLTPDDYARGGYETCLSFHGRDAAPRFVDAADALLRALPPEP